MKKSSNEIFLKEVYDLVGDEYTVLGEYEKSSIKIKMKHNVCGYDDWWVTPNKFKQGRRCPKCVGKTKGTTESFKQEVFDLVGDEYTVLGEYVTTNTPIQMRHNTCGYNDWFPTPNHFKSEKHPRRCPKCAGNIKGTTESFKQEVFDLVGDEYTVLGEYVNNATPIRMKHNVCGYDDWKPIPGNFTIRGARCPKCRLSERTYTTGDFKKYVTEITDGEYELIDDYKGNFNLVWFKHLACGNEFEMRPNNFQQGQRCPKCANNGKPSKKEIVTLDFIKSFYTEEIKTSHTGLLNNHKELDIFLPDKNVAIEFDGLYWHSDRFKNKNYHLEKTIECEENGIQLVHVFEDEWNNKQDIVKSKLKYILGYSKDLPKIRASECHIKELSVSDKNQFLDENHIQGADKSSIKLGLWYNINENEDRLVSVMTFCKPRKSLNASSKYDYELSRFATDIEFQVYGAFDKLFKHFKNNYEWNTIITYADRRWSKGGLYESTGFKLDHVSTPNYWYCKYSANNSKRIHRFVFRKSELKTKFPELYNESLTEFEIMDKTNYSRIWDCGNLVYTYTK